MTHHAKEFEMPRKNPFDYTEEALDAHHERNDGVGFAWVMLITILLVVIGAGWLAAKIVLWLLN